MNNILVGKCDSNCNDAIEISQEEALNLLGELNNWTLTPDDKEISKSYSFKNFSQVMFFVNAVAYICQTANHHPDIKLGYNYCEIKFTTHAIGGLSRKDFACAAKIDKLIDE